MPSWYQAQPPYFIYPSTRHTGKGTPSEGLLPRYHIGGGRMKPDIKGLKKLARYLRRVPREKFHMDDWVRKGASCGTVGCIAGWAAMLFPYRFKLSKTYEAEDGIRYYVIHRVSNKGDEWAFANGFRLPVEIAAALVYNPDITTPKQAAKEVMKIVDICK